MNISIQFEILLTIGFAAIALFITLGCYTIPVARVIGVWVCSESPSVLNKLYILILFFAGSFVITITLFNTMVNLYLQWKGV